MAKGAWIGVGGKARKIKNMYIGIGGKARKIKKAWIGIGGKARLFYSAEATNVVYNKLLSTTVASLNSGYGNENHAFFKAIPTGDGNSNVAYAFNNSFTRSTVSTTHEINRGMKVAANSAYIFAGGGLYYRTSNADTVYGTVNAFNSSLTRSTATNGISVNISASGGRFMNYAFFAGGGSNGTNSYSTIWLYDTSLTQTTISFSTALRNPRKGIMTDYLVFAGGHYYSSGTKFNATIQAFNTSLTRTVKTPTLDYTYASTGWNNEYAIYPNASTTNVINKSLTESTTTALSGGFVNNYLPTGSGSPGVAVFVGGGKNYYTPIANVQTYDTSLTKAAKTALTVSRLTTCVVNLNNNYFLIGGGCTGYDFGDEDTEGRDTYDNKVYVYNIE